MTRDDFARWFVEDIAEMSHAERNAVNKVARHFYGWRGAGATVGELIDAMTNPPKVTS